MIRIDNSVELIDVPEWSEDLIESAYRTCYRSTENKPNSEFITKCIKLGHLSPLEFAFASFKVVCSRAASHQIVRHRIASYAQESQRRTKVSNKCILPNSFYTQLSSGPDVMLSVHNWIEAKIDEMYECYEYLIAGGISKEDARYVLPSGFITTIMIGMNFRELRHFFKMRCEPDAQWEIRDIAKRMLMLIYAEAPSVFEDMYIRYIINEVKDAPLWTEAT